MKMTGPYWVYVHTTPDGMVYVGRSGRKTTEQRWSKYRYEGTSLYPYIEKYGMDNIKHFFIDGLSKEESYRLEGELIQIYKEKGVCINKKNSHGLCCDGDEKPYHAAYREHINEKSREWVKNNPEKRKEISHKYYINHKDEHNKRVAKCREKRLLQNKENIKNEE